MIMKRLFSLLVVLVLLVSIVPLTFAEERSREQGKDSQGRGAVRDVGIRTASENTRGMNEKLLTVPEKLRELRKANVERMTLVKEKRMEMKETLRTCTETESEDCRSLRKEVRSQIKHSLQKMTERISTVLTHLKERVESSELENKDTILQEITDALAGIENAKTKVMALTQDSTKEEIKTAISELRSSLQEAKKLVRTYYVKAQITEQRLENAIRKFTKLAENIDDRLTRFENRGYDFSSLREKLELMKAEVEKAQQSLDADNREAALTSLQNAHRLTLEILKEFKANLPPPSDDTGDGNETDDGDDSDDNEGNETDDSSNETEDDSDEDEEEDDDDEEDDDNEGNETEDDDNE